MWSRMNYKKIILPISILIVIDQVVKLLIKKYLFDIQIVFIEGIIGFFPRLIRIKPGVETISLF